MWSLFNKKSDDGIMQFSGEKLEPLKFTNNKTQADVVKEILEAIEQGNKIILIKGMCGSGKSAIALNLARHFNKTAIVVPIKSLQEQYENDYTNKKFILKKDNSKLKISVIKGRNNFKCPFLGESADSEKAPCKIEITEKNIELLKKYFCLNSNISATQLNFVDLSLDLKDLRRMSVAPACPFWSPLFPSNLASKALEKAVKKKYKSVSGEEYAVFLREKGCGYYDQYQGYIDSDVLIFNSQKYLLETLMGRKPKTDLDIIDECDEFLDNLSQERAINLSRLLIAISSIKSKEKRGKIQSMMFEINEILGSFSENIIERIENTKILHLIESIIANSDIAEDEEDNYFNRALEIAAEFEDYLLETYVSFKKDNYRGQDNFYVNLVTINLEEKLKSIIDKNNVIVMMSGTLHSAQVMKDIFGVKNFKVIEAETSNPGIITKFRTGIEKNCKFENFKSGLVTRKDYLLALNSCVEKAKKPVLIHVHSFSDLPTDMEKHEFSLKNLITKEELTEKQMEGKQIDKFKNKEIDLLFTTKCSRGIDFPGEQCNSVILTKYPYPDTQSLFWQLLKREKPDKFMEFYLDKAKRELMQKIYRGLRFKEDRIILLSPDSRVMDLRF